MKQATFTSILLVLLITTSKAQAPVDDRSSTVDERSSTSFLENKGQWNPRAKYLLHSGGMNLWITDSGIVYDLFRVLHSEPMMSFPRKRESRFFTRKYYCAGLDSRFRGNDNHQCALGHDTITRSGHIVRMSFLHTMHPKSIASNPVAGTTNYFIGDDPSKWVTGAHSFGNVTVQNLYDGVDAVFYLDNGQPRYDLVLQPGADESKIEMKIEGADGIESRTANSLTIRTSMGNIEELGLFAYQNVSGVK